MLSKKHNSSSSCWFQPIWKILVKMGIFPNRGENKKSLKPPPSSSFLFFFFKFWFFAGPKAHLLRILLHRRKIFSKRFVLSCRSKRPNVAVVKNDGDRMEIMDRSNKTLLLFTTITVFPFHLQATPCWLLYFFLRWKHVVLIQTTYNSPSEVLCTKVKNVVFRHLKMTTYFHLQKCSGKTNCP